MSLTIVKHREAERDLTQAFVYLGERNLDAAERFIDAVEADLRKLADMPGMGALRDFRHPSLSDIRSWPVTGFRNYLIFYSFDNATLRLIAVLHGARDLERVLTERARS